MRRLILLSALLHGVAAVLVLSRLTWKLPPPPAEPARIEVLFGHVRDPAATVSPAPPGEAGAAAAMASPDIRGSEASPPGADAANASSNDIAGVRIDEPDAQTVAAQEDTGNHQPDYPQAAALAREQGRMVLRLHIDPEGNVIGIDQLQSSGHDLLDRAAVAELAHWHFRPAMRNGMAIAWDRDQPVDFVISR